jgi:hypothetical protein
VEAAGVVVGDDLERAHEQVEESRRRAEKACAAKRFASSRQSSVNQSPLFFSPDSTAHTFPPFFLVNHFCYSYHYSIQTAPAGSQRAAVPRRGGEERPPPKAVSATVQATQAGYPKAFARSRPGDHATAAAWQRRPDMTRGRGGHEPRA